MLSTFVIDPISAFDQALESKLKSIYAYKITKELLFKLFESVLLEVNVVLCDLSNKIRGLPVVGKSPFQALIPLYATSVDGFQS